jgi:uncharacterized protein YndB with AHSA1/START domain
MTAEINIHDDGPMIVATAVVPSCTPDRALAAFTDPGVVTHWWRGELTPDPVKGGPYTVNFPAIPARLTGEVLRLEHGKLEFTWSWDDAPPDSTVTITTEPGHEPNSALLTLKHGPHKEDAAGRVAHQEHWEGWELFLPRLVNALRAQIQGP